MEEKNWIDAQEFEKNWWGDCINTVGEELKQTVYARKMGFLNVPWGRFPYRYDLEGISVLDIGGGSISLLLKCFNFSKAKVIDPIKFPDWVYARYLYAGINFEIRPGEEIKEAGWNEVWLYNVLQHCQNPEKVILAAKEAGKIIRIFEWLDMPKNIGHLHTLRAGRLNKWLGGIGKTEVINQLGARGHCFYGIFPT